MKITKLTTFFVIIGLIAIVGSVKGLISVFTDPNDIVGHINTEGSFLLLIISYIGYKLAENGIIKK